MVTSYYLSGFCCLMVFPVLVKCCQKELVAVYSRMSGSAAFQFSVNPPSTGYNTYEVRNNHSIPILRAQYSPLPGNVEINPDTTTFTGNASTGNLSFILKNVQQSDYGIYSLVIFGATPLQCQTLYILGKPTTPTVGPDETIAVNETVSIPCMGSVSTTLPNDHGLSINYSWTIDGNRNPVENRYTYSSNRQTLTVSEVNKFDGSKVFTCMATEVVDRGLTSNRSNTYSINVLYGPDSVLLNPHTEGYTKNEGTQLPNILCSADCNPSCTYAWEKQGQTAAISSTGTLILGTLQRSEAGTYICSATNPQTHNIQKTHVIIYVLYAPSVLVSLSNTEFVEGALLHLSCNVITGVPVSYNHTDLTQTWGSSAIPNSRLPISNTPIYSSLQFTSLRLEDSGTYTCHVTNGVKDVDRRLDQTATVDITVKVSPKVLKESLQFVGALNSPINISIPFYSYPEVFSVTLIRSRDTIINNDSMHLVSYQPAEVTTQFYGADVNLNGSIFYFYIYSLSEEDFSNYTLRFQNEIGASESTVNIILESKPVLPKEFRLFGVLNKLPQFDWEKGFNGGYKQYFIIETTPVGTDNWEEQVRIDEDSHPHYLSRQSYITNITGLQPGQYSARLLAENKVGTTDGVTKLTIAFELPDCDCQSTQCSTKDNTLAVAGGLGATVGVVVIGAIVLVVLLQRRNHNEDTVKKSANAKTRQTEETFQNELFEADNNDTQIRGVYESLNDQFATNPNYDSYVSSEAESPVEQPPKEYENFE